MENTMKNASPEVCPDSGMGKEGEVFSPGAGIMAQDYKCNCTFRLNDSHWIHDSEACARIASLNKEVERLISLLRVWVHSPTNCVDDGYWEAKQDADVLVANHESEAKK
ncbi:hypothetical protein OAF54_01135 [bacterium]|nr:hypothetical protein [bacterium]